MPPQAVQMPSSVRDTAGPESPDVQAHETVALADLTDLSEPRSAAARVFCWCVRCYWAAPRWRLPCCRFEPTCSRYAFDAVALHGAVRGVWLAVRRLSRCHRWGSMGYDPVPVPPADVPRRAGAQRPDHAMAPQEA